MEYKYSKVALIGKHYKKAVSQTMTYLYRQLKNADLEVVIETESAEDVEIDNITTLELSEIPKHCDVAIIVGGDGNFLQASRVLALYGDIPVIGVNKGKLGFLATINPDKDTVCKQILPILKGESVCSEASMLRCAVDDNYQVPLESAIALNEISITADRGQMIGLKVYIDNEYAFDQRGDGIIVTTPTGSTAYAMSAGGPILHPNQNSLSIVPICSHSLNSRPLVISDDSRIDIYVTRYNNPKPILSIDGRSELVLEPSQKISIIKSSRKVQIVHQKDYNHYKTLRNKLGWSKVLF